MTLFMLLIRRAVWKDHSSRNKRPVNPFDYDNAITSLLAILNHAHYHMEIHYCHDWGYQSYFPPHIWI